MEFSMDDIDDTLDEKLPEEPNALSRSISGTFQAIPARVIEDETETETPPPPAELPLPVDKLTKERRDFCNSMLTDNVVTNENMLDQVKRKKVDLMAEIRSQVRIKYFSETQKSSVIVLFFQQNFSRSFKN